MPSSPICYELTLFWLIFFVLFVNEMDLKQMSLKIRVLSANSSPPLISAGFLGGAMAAWVFFELLEYHLLTLVCYMLIGALAIFFLYCNAHTFIYKHPPSIPKVHILEDPSLQVVSKLTIEINRGFAVLREIASGKELKKFLYIYRNLAFSHLACACRYVFIVSFLQHYLLTKELFILNRHIPPKFVETIEDIHPDMVV
ncbi:hypothetical protein UlMin_020519 [Ulmus minor]